MSPETALALTGFAFVMSVSPGPGNILLLASGVNFGFLRSLPLVLGISAGFLAMVLAIGLGLGPVLERFPLFGLALRFACCAYVLWLAWKIAGSRSLGGGVGSIGRPVGFLQAAALQLVNPKAWTVALVVTVTYTDPRHLTASLLTLIAIFAVVNIPSISLWAICGAALRSALSQGRRIVVFNLAMAVLLVASTLPALIEM